VVGERRTLAACGYIRCRGGCARSERSAEERGDNLDLGPTSGASWRLRYTRSRIRAGCMNGNRRGLD